MRIEGFFGNMKNAVETVNKLKQSGFRNAYVDINENSNNDRDLHTNLAGTETAMSLSALVMEGTNANKVSMDKSPLSAASPMVSGIGTFDEIADVKCRIVVEAQEAEVSQVKQIIREMGGDLESPNVKKPKLRNDAEVIVKDTLKNTREFLEAQEKR